MTRAQAPRPGRFPAARPCGSASDSFVPVRVAAGAGRRTFLGLALSLGGAALAWAQVSQAPSFSEAARRRLGLGPSGGTGDAEWQQLLADGQAQIDHGDAEAALETLDRAARMHHAAAVELATARALMAAGRYRHALAACAHAAGAHREQSAGMALYAWLLHLGGQQVVSLRLLDEARRSTPSDALLTYTRDQLAGDWPLAGGPLLEGPARAAPPAFARAALDAAPAEARVVGTAVLLADGLEALLPRGLVRDEDSLWVRDGLGLTTQVIAPPSPLDPDLCLLRLRTAAPRPAWRLAAREPFAGSPGCAVEYVPDPAGRAAWPLLRQGFFAGVPGAAASRPLGFDMPKGPRGGPVFDASGRLAGVALAGEPDRLFGLARLNEVLPAQMPGAGTDLGGPRVGPEVAYEASLRGTLQVLAVHRPGGS